MTKPKIKLTVRQIGANKMWARRRKATQAAKSTASVVTEKSTPLGSTRTIMPDLNIAKAPDLINHPPHYKTPSGLEAIDVIEAFELNYHLGNAVKYLLRANKKGTKASDLKKAIWYINREIENGLKKLIESADHSD